jgi:acetoin utilization deacetylase AcuC-like enzyme
MDAAQAATAFLELPEVSLEDLNGVKSSPLHIAAASGSAKVWALILSNAESRKGAAYVTRLLSLKDNLNKTPLEVASTYGFAALLTADANGCNESAHSDKPTTAILSHPLCRMHYTCPPSETEAPSAPPENIKRLHVIIDERNGCLRGSDLAPRVQFIENCHPASMGDVLRVHEWGYVRRLQATCEQVQRLSDGIPADLAAEEKAGITHLDGDTALSRESFRAAMHAAGSLCQGVDMVMKKEVRNAFCAVRPPGHHAGPQGLVKGEVGGPDSHGFCLLNNISIGAAYALTVHRDVVKKVAIVDFDVHHGNGTEETIRWLKPSVTRVNQDFGGYGFGEVCIPHYKPWFGEKDTENVMFVSVHGYGPQERGLEHMFPQGAFYPGSGRTVTPANVLPPSVSAETAERPLSESEKEKESKEVMESVQEGNSVEEVKMSGGDEDEDDEDDDDYEDKGGSDNDSDTSSDDVGESDPNLSSNPASSNPRIDKMLRIYEPTTVSSTDTKETWLSSMPPMILDVGVNLPEQEYVNGEYRHKWRNYFREHIFPRLMEFRPDCIFLSAGFDAHRKDEINGGYIALVEEDYDWVTANLIRIANTVCDGRVVSALEGGYMTKGEHCSSFAKSVKAHVAAMCTKEGINSSAKYSAEEAALEQGAEHQMIRALYLKRQQRAEQESLRIAQHQTMLAARHDQDQRDMAIAVSTSTLSSVETAAVSSSTTSAVEMEASSADVVVDEGSVRKRRRGSGSKVDYVALNKELMENK